MQKINESLHADSEKKLYLIVPEQFTLQTERDLIEKLKLPGIMQLEVLSFTRLAHKVLSEAGGITRTTINEQGKNMVLRKIIDEYAKELTIYKDASKQDGFISKFADLISQLKQFTILPEDFNELKNENNSILLQKIHDIQIIYKLFNEYLKGRYIDTEDFISLLIEKIEKAEFLKDALIWIDGFTTFTPQMLKIIEKIMLLSDNIEISITIDFAGNSHDMELFTAPKLTYNKIHKLAQKRGIKEEIINNNSRNSITKNKEIIHLERELYAQPYNVYHEKPNAVKVFAGTNLDNEIENAAFKILKLVRDENYRWRDIAVVCNDIECYGSIIKRIFTENNIPFFLDQKRDIMKMILSIIDIVSKNFKYEDVFQFLKTGFSDLNIDEYEKLENYTLKYGVKGNGWNKKFVYGSEDECMEMNEYRIKLIKPLQKFKRNIHVQSTIAEITGELYELLEKFKIREKLEIWIEELRNQELYEYVNENAQIWNIVMDIFDQMVEFLGEQTISLKNYKKILESGFMSCQIGIIPTTIDQVLVGNIQRSKSSDVKALFVVGVNDGILPSKDLSQGILSEEEISLLKEEGIDLGLESDFKNNEERFLIHQALSKPREYLWVSYAVSDTEGKALRPSIIINRIKKIFIKINIESDVNKKEKKEMISSPQGTFKKLVENLRLRADGNDVEDYWWDVYKWYYFEKEWDELRLSVLDGIFYTNRVGSIGYEKSKKLFRYPFKFSVSRLEQFAKCPFAHFIKYGLRPQERKIFEIKAPDIGELFHNSLLNFTKKVNVKKLDWFQLEKKQTDEIMNIVMDELIPEYSNGILESNYRYKYLSSRLKRVGKRAVWTITEHIKNGDFKPLGFEVSFGENCTFPSIKVILNNGETVYLEGRIDRVDILEEKDKAYIKIIDYKSGDKDFNLSDVYNGLTLQLIIYLNAVLESRNRLRRNKELKPAGVFYFKIDDPLINSDKKIIEKVEKEIRKKLKMKGLVLKDARLVKKIDKNINGYSEIIPVALNKNDEFYNSSVLNEESFSGLLEHVNDLIKEICSEIISGNIEIEPIKNDNKKACEYCLYKSICQFDTLFKDNDYKYYKKINNKELISKLPE
jgi:ATP-dependent helicase/nuclease subunit B